VIRPSPLSRYAVGIDFGGVVARIASDSMALTDRFAGRFPDHVTDEAATFEVEAIPRARLTAVLAGREPGGAEPLRFAASTYDTAVDLPGRRAWIAGRVRPGTVVNVMRYLLPLLLPGGVAFHAGVLAEEDRGFLMAGRSGSGKSSLARLLRGRALGDEIGVVLPAASGFTVHGSPHRVGRRGGARLAGVYLLARGERHERARLDPGAALGRLAALAFWPLGHEREMRSTLEALGCLVETVPVWELRFRLQSDVWETIAASPEAG
jgi:hypothetical protein